MKHTDPLAGISKSFTSDPEARPSSPTGVACPRINGEWMWGTGSIDEPMNRPNLFVVGPPRSATTSLAWWLRAHPEIMMSRPKEPGYHSRDLKMTGAIDDLDEYLALYSQAANHKLLGDATPWYLFSSVAASSIHDMSPHARIVIGLRHPVDMLASLHNHHVYMGFEKERDFAEAVFGRSRRNENADFRVGIDYLSVGRLGEQVQRFLDHFPRKQLLAVRFEELIERPEKTYPALLEQLAVSRFALGEYRALNSGVRARSIVVNRYLRSISEQTSDNRWIENMLRRLRAMNTQRWAAQTPPEVRRDIVASLEDDIRLLEGLLDVDLSHWQR